MGEVRLIQKRTSLGSSERFEFSKAIFLLGSLLFLKGKKRLEAPLTSILHRLLNIFKQMRSS